MRRLPDNLMLETAVKTYPYSMYSNEQCPKALAWMAALCVASGHGRDAQTWLVELIGAVVFKRGAVANHAASTSRDTASMS